MDDMFSSTIILKITRNAGYKSSKKTLISEGITQYSLLRENLYWHAKYNSSIPK